MSAENAGQNAPPPTSEPPAAAGRLALLEETVEHLTEWVAELDEMATGQPRMSLEERVGLPPTRSKGTP